MAVHSSVQRRTVWPLNTAEFRLANVRAFEGVGSFCQCLNALPETDDNNVVAGVLSKRSL